MYCSDLNLNFLLLKTNTMPKKNSVAFNRRPDPPFIAQFKQRLAYKEGDTVDTKVL